jgi:hypothetical protein
MRKKQLTFDEHKELGARLKNIQKELNEVADIIGQTYGWSSDAGKLAESMARPIRAKITPLQKLILRMDDRLFLEAPRWREGHTLHEYSNYYY